MSDAQSATYEDMLSAIQHVLDSPEHAAGGDSAEMIALAICAALAERRSAYVPLPATILDRKIRAKRNRLILSMAADGATPSRIARRINLSSRQVRRILSQHPKL